MNESRLRVSYYSEKEGSIALDLDDLNRMLNTGHGYHKITKSRPSRFCDVVGRSRLNDDGELVFMMEAGALEVEPTNFDPTPRLVDIGEIGREHPVPMPNVSKPGIATEEHPLTLSCKWETITESKGSKKDEETVTIALDDLQQLLNTGHGYHEITKSRSSGSVSIIRRTTATPNSGEESQEVQEREIMDRRPIEYCYWVEPGQFLAGEYPMVKDDEEASRTKLVALTEAGVNIFIDLTQDGELSPYYQWLDSDQTYYRFPIWDVSIPDTPETTATILDAIDAHIAKGDVVYLHCWGGVGRTGTIVGCWLTRHGYPGTAALEHLAELWAKCPKSAWTPSPETEAQRQYVREWWFGELTGFAEESPEQVRANLSVDGHMLKSHVNGKTLVCGELETPSLAALRQRVQASGYETGAMTVREVVANVQKLHTNEANAGALFQVASQFNLLEMVHEEVTPEDGITRYAEDRTQGPACAIAAGAGTIYRNYFTHVNGQTGQSATNQIDCLADIGAALGNTENHLWDMSNGYALPSYDGLDEIRERLRASSEPELDALRQLLRIGIQWQTQVTLDNCTHTVSQAYCSALPVTGSLRNGPPSHMWEEFDRLILEASYEATLCAALVNAGQTGNNTVFLTLVGGGAFGAEPEWIIDSLQRTLDLYQQAALDVAIVSYGSSNPDIQHLVGRTDYD